MSAPKTNIEKQEKRHRWPLRGIVLSVVFAALLGLGLVTYLAYQGNEPRTPDVRIDGRTGEEVQAD